MFIIRYYDKSVNRGWLGKLEALDSHKETKEFINKHRETVNLVEIWHISANFGASDLDCELAERVYPAIDENDPPDTVWAALIKAKVGDTVVINLANKKDFLYGNRHPMTFTVLSATRFA